MCPKISLSKRESFVIPPLEEEVDSTASAVEDGGVLFSSHVFCSTIDFRTPSELFSRKKFSSLFKMDSYNKCIVSNLIPHLIQAGELILFCFKMLFI